MAKTEHTASPRRADRPANKQGLRSFARSAAVSVSSKQSGSRTEPRNRAVISVVGRDRVGIIAHITTALAGENANILDISQTILDGFFTMMAIVDLSHISCPFSDLADRLEKVGRQLGVDVRCQREEIFTSMERI